MSDEYTYITFEGPEGGLVIKRLPDGVFIPEDINNLDYQAYLVWLANQEG